MSRVTVARRTRSAFGAIALLLALAAPAAAALDVLVKDVQTPADAVRTTIELRDIVPDRFRRMMMDDGRVLHLRVQAELWESHPIWDRLVYPAIVRVFRLGRTVAGRNVAITDPDGGARTFPSVPSMMPIVLELGDRNRVALTEKYYVHVIATLGTLAETEADEVGDAVFGGEGETNSLGALGRLAIKTAMKVSDYLQSVSAEARSRKLAGSDILRRPSP